MTRVVMPDERCPLLDCGWERVDEPGDTRESIAVAIRGHLDECHPGWTTAELQAAVLVRQLPTVFRAGVVELFGPMSAPPWDRRNPDPPDPDDLTLVLNHFSPAPDQVMVVDAHNIAHILVPDRCVRPTLCGDDCPDLWALAPVLDILAAPWSLLTDEKYRAGPAPIPCQTCLARAATQSTTLTPKETPAP